MDIVEIIKVVIGESATAALALFAIWSLKKLHEQRLEERKSHAEEVKKIDELRIEERNEYIKRLEALNQIVVTSLEASTNAWATNTEVIRQNTEVLGELQLLLRKKGK